MPTRCRKDPGRRLAMTSCLLAMVLAASACSSDQGSPPDDGQPDASASARVSSATAPDSPPTAGPETGDLAMVGRVSRDGEPVADVDLVASIWPDDLASIGEGERVDIRAVAEDVTDEQGRFSLSIDIDDITSAYMPADQSFLNVDITATGEGFFGTTANTIYRIDDAVWRGSDRARVGDPVMGLEIDLASEQVRVRESDGVVSQEGFPTMQTD